MRKVNYTRHIGIVISEKTYQQLVKITDEKEIPLSQFIRDVLPQSGPLDGRFIDLNNPLSDPISP